MYPDYLVHYNKNHSKSNGQFVSGDGDGDGIANDHAHRSESGSGRKRKNPNGYAVTSEYQKGKKKLKQGFYYAAAGDVLAFSGNVLASSISNSNVSSGIKFISGYSGLALNVMGIANIARGGKEMSTAARKYNSEHN